MAPEHLTWDETVEGDQDDTLWPDVEDLAFELRGDR